MGRGPLELIGEGGLPERLGSAGHDVEVLDVAEPTETHEIGRVFELNRELARLVAAVRESGRLPLILSGNCSACLGAIAGINGSRTAIVWLDAHPDFHTPETSDSGFLDGMGLATATGACWSTLASSIPGFHPVEERNTILVGVRDVDPGEQQRLDSAAVAVVEGGAGPGRLPAADLRRAIATVADHSDRAYLHLDFDSIDPSFGSANEYATRGGLDIEDIQAVTSSVAERMPIAAVSFTAYNPEVDTDGRFRATAVEVVGDVVERLVRPSSKRPA
jgi:arginase